MHHTADIRLLSVAFQAHNKTITALDKLDFTLSPGKTLVLLGESGCGKSLTSLALMRLLPPSGVYGAASCIYFGDQDLLNIPETMMRMLRGRSLAMIFQEPMTALNPVMTVGAQIAEVLETQSAVENTPLSDRVIALLQEVEMPQPEVRMHQYPHQLSGGQKQRVVIAMALARAPELLIADEPTTALDVTVQAQILTLLQKIQKSRQMSMLLITHDLGVARTMADEICVLYAGQVVEQASVADFFRQELHPYVQQLCASVPTFAKREERLSVIHGSVPSLEEIPTGCRFHPRCPYVMPRCRQEEPQLQELDKRLLRCHLYPDIKELPDLNKDRIFWNASTATDEPLLCVSDLSIQYAHKKGGFLGQKTVFKAVDALSFTLGRGKTLALVGESGCGKTTTARALLRLIPVSQGGIRYQDQDVLALKGKALKRYRKKVQIIFQDPFSSMNPRMTVGAIIAEGMHAQGMKASFIAKRQIQLLDQVHLPKNSLTRYPHQFSGGQRQRICIARALATEPELLVCDEPTSALDLSVQAQILNVLKELQQETGIAYLFITHNMGVVSYIADDVLVMKGGRAVEYGRCAQIFQNPEHAYTQQLVQSALEMV